MAAAAVGESIHLEAEKADLRSVRVSRDLPGFSGDGYVDEITNDTDTVTFVFDAEERLYDLKIGYGSPEFKRALVRVNDIPFEADLRSTRAEEEGAAPGSTGVFKEYVAGTFRLEDGTNRITIGGGWGGYEIDYLKLVPTAPRTVAPVPARLSDPKADAAARRLFGYLRSVYGKKTLSGQYGIKEFRRVNELVGKSPAILGADLIKYSPSRIEHGEKPEGSSEHWIQFTRDTGAILTLCWHWNAPTDLINNEEHQWWSGFYSNATTFDIKAALADKDSERYRLLLRDIDAIAAELKKFENAGIAVLWRPLHEASGGWFWWGAGGPQAFIELWRLVYDRIVNHHGIHNLIWVHTYDHPEWYPGDSFVDLIGADEYEPTGSYFGGEWLLGLDLFDGKRMLSISECGSAPNTPHMSATGTRWLTFVVWSGDYLENMPVEYLESVYHHEDVINLDDLPDANHMGIRYWNIDTLAVRGM